MDWFHIEWDQKTLDCFCAGALVFNVADSLVTISLIGIGYREASPVAYFVMQFGGTTAFSVLKLVIGTAIIASLYLKSQTKDTYAVALAYCTGLFMTISTFNLIPLFYTIFSGHLMS